MTLAHDLRSALRQLRRSPAIAAAAIGALALGIGAVAASLAVLRAVLLNPLAYRDAGSVVEVYQTHLPDADSGEVPVAPASFLDWQAESRSFEDMAIYRVASLNLSGEAPAERVRAVRASVNLFTLLGTEALLGRTFGHAQDRSGSERVVVLGHDIWQAGFGSDADVIGRIVRVDGEPHTVIGVMPASFSFPARWNAADVWVPLVLAPAQQNRDAREYSVVARLRPGVTLAAAAAEMHAVGRRLEERHPAQNEGLWLQVRGAGEPGPRVRRMLLLPLAAALGVLLIACANVAGLLLARGTTRRRELALRAALGAGRARLVQLLAVEILVLSLAGAAIATALLALALPVLESFAPPWLLPRAGNVRLDPGVVALAFGVSVMAGAIGGLVPALRSSIAAPQSLLSQAAATPRRHRAMHAAIVWQVTAAVVVLSAAGLLLKNVSGALRADPGFDAAGLSTMRIGLAAGRYREPADWDAFFRRAREAFAALPGVEGLAFGQSVPGANRGDVVSLTLPGRHLPGPGGRGGADYVRVDAGYHELLGVPLERGRYIDDGDVAGAPRVAVVNRAFVRRYLPDAELLGQTVSVTPLYGESRRSPGPTDMVIVGVVSDIREHALADGMPVIYAPARQDPAREMILVVRASAAAAPVVAAVRNRLRQIDPDQALWHVRTVRELYGENLALHRFHLWLVGGFGAIALLLAGVGVFSILSHWVAERTREIGVRLALGGTPRDLVWMVLRRTFGVTAAGLVPGAAVALILPRLADPTWDLGWFFAQSLDTGLPADPVTTAAAATCIVVVALLAAWLPAWRAVRVDPILALRQE